jgi:hypothetical protein
LAHRATKPTAELRNGSLTKIAIQSAKALAGLKVEKAGIDGQRKVAEADLGPVCYLAALLGASDQDVLRWFILVVTLLLDPAAVLLLLAAASAVAFDHGPSAPNARWRRSGTADAPS